ncbi:hypothetical protein OQJ05_12105 [Fluoribacter gormanii]|uniref:hypothetical protein n=1 Tax=Fluoribacter gormanii TaxID=464 RepID=UPI002244175B|nr:hypothetical protein [Fluoribacter gormanii]MCW8444792.1 hypothetical protein [Fluoribacter gormanii]
MKTITVTKDRDEIVLLDIGNIRLHEMSKYYTTLSQYNKLDEAIELLSNLDEKEYWRAAILLKNLNRKKEDEKEPEVNYLIEQCKDFSLLFEPNSDQLTSMKGLSCYRVGADAGAGFKEGDLDVLGTEGILDCTGVLVVTEDEKGTPCYYMAHIFGDRTTKVSVQEELDRILSDIQELTSRELLWSDLTGQVTLVGTGSNTDDPSLCYKQTFKILTQEGAKPTPLFGSNVAFNLTGKGDLIILDPTGQLHQGIQSSHPKVGHGVYSPVNNINELESNQTINEQIDHDFSYTNKSLISKL